MQERPGNLKHAQCQEGMFPAAEVGKSHLAPFTACGCRHDILSYFTPAYLHLPQLLSSLDFTAFILCALVCSRSSSLHRTVWTDHKHFKRRSENFKSLSSNRRQDDHSVMPSGSRKAIRVDAIGGNKTGIITSSDVDINTRARNIVEIHSSGL